MSRAGLAVLAGATVLLVAIALAATQFPLVLAQRGPARSSFVFVAAGDFGFGEAGIATLDRMAASGADLALGLGDLSYGHTPTEAAWCDAVHARFGAAFPFAVVAGNHEDDAGGDGHIRAFAACLPDRLGAHGDYPEQYYVDYGRLARLILISPDLTIDGVHYYYGQSTPNYAWLADAIDGARAAGLPWVIVGMHKSCLSVGPYHCRVYEDLLNLLVAKRVDLVLHAHDHSYQRTRQLAHGPGCALVHVDAFEPSCVAGDGVDGVFERGRGPVFAVVGTGGVDLYPLDAADPEAGYFARWMGLNAEPRHGFLRVAVTGASLSAEFVGSTGTSSFTDRFEVRALGAEAEPRRRAHGRPVSPAAL
jgi:hypothetical protein